MHIPRVLAPHCAKICPPATAEAVLRNCLSEDGERAMEKPNMNHLVDLHWLATSESLVLNPSKYCRQQVSAASVSAVKGSEVPYLLTECIQVVGAGAISVQSLLTRPIILGFAVRQTPIC